MDITSQITVAVKPGLYQDALKAGAFKPGSTLQLKVLELNGSRALIDFGNFRATADIKIPVTRGQEIVVKVMESSQKLKLRLLNPNPARVLPHDLAPQLWQGNGSENFNKVQQQFKLILNQLLESQSTKNTSNPILNILNTLNAHFESFDLDKILPDLTPRLKSFVDHSGIFFEKFIENTIIKLVGEPDAALPKQLAHHPDVQTLLRQDLKANLLALKHMAEDEAALQKALDFKSLANLRRAVDFFLSDINQQQGRAVKQLDSADPFQVFFFTLPLAEENQAVKLKIYYPKKQNAGSQEGFQISLLLLMDRLGELRTDFFLLNQDLKVTFFVPNESTNANIQKNCLALQKILNPLFNQVRLRVMVSEKKIKDFVLEDVQPAGDRRVDLRI